MDKNIPPKRILVPIDFSSASRTAASYAAKIAEPLGAELVLLHVIASIEEVEALLQDHESIDWTTARDDAALEADKLLETLGVAIGNIDVRRIVREGSPAPTTADTAEEIGADMVVVGSHGRTGLVRALLGSVAERICRLSPVPVLVVRWKGDS
jgi:nucleotide-binding universal stress UspA family protein